MKINNIEIPDYSLFVARSVENPENVEAIMQEANNALEACLAKAREDETTYKLVFDNLITQAQKGVQALKQQIEIAKSKQLEKMTALVN